MSSDAVSEDRVFTLRLSCPDRQGIVARVAGFLADHACNILESAQFGDSGNGRFFMRVCFRSEGSYDDHEVLAGEFEPIKQEFRMDAMFYRNSCRARVLIMVSRFGHCLNDLLFRRQIGALDMDIAGVVSNHRDFESLATLHGVPFTHIAVTRETKPAAEAQLRDIIEREEVDLVVLARYMQVLSKELTRAIRGRAINIHHSFLPSFKGARPYQQAHERGVKLIGATAHYVTEDLDEGPIIEQDVARIDHAQSVRDFVSIGRDIERVVLARAVKWHLEQRVLLNGKRTVVFR